MKICEICGTVEGALLEVVIDKNESHIYCKDCIAEAEAAGRDEIGQIAKEAGGEDYAGRDDEEEQESVRPVRKRSGAR